MEEEQQQAQRHTEVEAHNEKLIKTNNITAYIKTNKEKWDSCLIKTGPNSYVGPAFCLKCFVIIV